MSKRPQLSGGEITVESVPYAQFANVMQKCAATDVDHLVIVQS